MKLQIVHHAKELSQILRVFMPECYKSHDRNYTYLYSDLHNNTITYSDVQVYIF